MKRETKIALIQHHLLDRGLWFNKIKNPFLLAFGSSQHLETLLEAKDTKCIDAILSDIKTAKASQQFFNQLYL